MQWFQLTKTFGNHYIQNKNKKKGNIMSGLLLKGVQISSGEKTTQFLLQSGSKIKEFNVFFRFMEMQNNFEKIVI